MVESVLPLGSALNWIDDGPGPGTDYIGLTVVARDDVTMKPLDCRIAAAAAWWAC